MINQVKLAIIAIAIVIPLASFAVYGTNSKIEPENTNNKLTVMSSFYPLHEFAQKIGQNRIDATLLVPAGVEPHEWEPTIQDVHRMQKADLIIINGIGFESWIDHLEKLNFQVNIVDTSKGITIKDKNIVSESFGYDEHKLKDPHIWLDPILAKIQVQNMADAFSKSDPENKNFYQNNAKNFNNDLDLLDMKIRNDLSNCNRDFIAFHNAFSYFADEYDLKQHTILSSNDPLSEPTAKTLETIIKTARALNIKIIFTEESVDPRTSQIVANELGGKILVLSPIEIGNDKDYISRMNKNLDNLKEALC